MTESLKREILSIEDKNIKFTRRTFGVALQTVSILKKLLNDVNTFSTLNRIEKALRWKNISKSDQFTIRDESQSK